jgi:RHS repeat-associated protein
LHAQDTVTYVYTDPNGTPLAETDAHGNITKTYDYTPYGTVALGSPPNGPGYAGHVNDPETNLVNMQARYYDPATGKFLSVDPVGPSAGDITSFNRYVYGGNNPIKNIDPNGRQYTPVEPPVAPEAAAAGEAEAAGIAAEAGAVRIIFVDPANPATFPPTVQSNKAAGDAFEGKVANDLKSQGSNVVQQITVKTDSGVRTRIDIVTKDANGNLQCVECKASDTAPLTKNQKAAFPEIQRSGATVVGQGKPGVPGGTRIPPQTVRVVRPPTTQQPPPPPPPQKPAGT